MLETGRSFRFEKKDNTAIQHVVVAMTAEDVPTNEGRYRHGKWAVGVKRYTRTTCISNSFVFNLITAELVYHAGTIGRHNFRSVSQFLFLARPRERIKEQRHVGF